MRRKRSMPHETLVPVLRYPDVREAARWLRAAFGFAERRRPGAGRTQLDLGEGAGVALARDGGTEESQGRVVDHIVVRVPDVDALCEQARQQGAAVLADPVDMPYGERQCTILDLADHPWIFTQTVTDDEPRVSRVRAL